MVKVLKRVLSMWWFIRKIYTLERNTVFPLEEEKDNLLQMYAIMQPLADIVTEVQNSRYPIAGFGLFKLVQYRKNVAYSYNCEERAKPLPVMEIIPAQ
jgi:hypothetical protein